jgi:antirestriction protein ArdC
MAKQHSTGDLYQRTTDRIIQALEAGTVPWIKPWTGSTRSGIPMNLSTGKEYRGVNVITLWCAGVRRGFEHDLWITYNQAQERGWQVRKGAKAEQIIKVGQVVTEDAETGDEKVHSYLRAFSVFNVAEVEGARCPVSLNTNGLNTPNPLSMLPVLGL